MLSYNTRHRHTDSQTDGFFRKLVLEAAAPFQKLMHISSTGVSESWEKYVSLVGVVEKNKELEKTIGELEAELLRYKEGHLEAQRLAKILALKESLSYDFIAARVIAKEQAALSKIVIIDKGSFDGLRSGMPVVSSAGLVGRLIDVSWNVAKALLIIDENSNVDVMLQRTRTQGIFSGMGYRGGVLKYITKNQDIAEGDEVISSGMGGVFPKGLMIGRVSSVEKLDTELFLKIRVAPYVDFSKLEEVLVLVAEEKRRK
jgi:rod shape-determining protein MreC